MQDYEDARKAYDLLVKGQTKVEQLLNRRHANPQALIKEAVVCCLDAADILGSLLKTSAAGREPSTTPVTAAPGPDNQPDVQL